MSYIIRPNFFLGRKIIELEELKVKSVQAVIAHSRKCGGDGNSLPLSVAPFGSRYATEESSMHEIVNKVNLLNLCRDGCNFS